MKYAALLILLAAPLHAFCLVPAGHTGGARIALTEAVIVHRGPSDGAAGVQELLLRVTPVVQGPLPQRLVWILPLPATPESFGVGTADALYDGIGVHSRLFALAREQWSSRTEYEWPEALTWLKKRESGELSPVGHEPLPDLVLAGAPVLSSPGGIGAEGVARLNDWLTSAGFNALAPDTTDWFAAGDFAFLCVEAAVPQTRPMDGAAIELPPIRVRVPAEAPFLPLVVGANRAPGRVDFTLISDTPLDTRPFMQLHADLKARAEGYAMLLNLWSVKPLPRTLASVMHPDSAAMPARWYANRLEAPDVPQRDGPLRADVVLPLGDLKDELPGFWYYADADISFVEKFFREHILAVTTSIFFLGLFSLMLKSRRDRRRASQPAE